MQKPPVVFIKSPVGAWRSLVAHQHGALGVVGSNPAAPTIFLQVIQDLIRAPAGAAPGWATACVQE